MNSDQCNHGENTGKTSCAFFYNQTILITVSCTGDYNHPYYVYADDEQRAKEGNLPEEEPKPNE